MRFNRVCLFRINMLLHTNNSYKAVLCFCNMQNYDALVERIVKASNLNKEEVERRIEARKAKLSGLISKEGAAQIIAAEAGVNLENQDLKISELMPGMKRVNVIGKVINLFPVREFEKNGRKGKVVNFFIADDTSNLRVVLWDTNHIALIEKQEIKEGDVVEIKNASMRDSELHLSGFSDIKKSDKILENVKTERVVKQEAIEDVKKGENVQIRAVVVQMFQPRFFHVCPECGKKAQQTSEGFECDEHGKVNAKERAILNFVMDDGTETIRVVMFSDQIEKLIAQEDLKNPEKLTAFREDMLGAEIYVKGQARTNKLFNNLEVIAGDVSKVDPEELIKELESG